VVLQQPEHPKVQVFGVLRVFAGHAAGGALVWGARHVGSCVGWQRRQAGRLPQCPAAHGRLGFVAG
jgi:hypothetical protein